MLAMRLRIIHINAYMAIYAHICEYMRIYAHIYALSIQRTKQFLSNGREWSRRENAKKKNSLLLHRSQHSPPPPATVNADEKYQTFLTLNLRSFEWEIFLAESLELFFAN